MNKFLGIELSTLLLIAIAEWVEVTCDKTSNGIPYEELIFEIAPGKHFHEHLKYPPYRKCVIPNDKVQRQRNALNPYGGNVERKWRLFWSQIGWNTYYLDDEEAPSAWESIREDPVPVNQIIEHGLPIAFVIGWILIITIVNLFLYPLVSMITIRIMLFVWSLISNRFVKLLIRWILIRSERFQRDHILRVYEDAGRRPPFYRYSLPRFVRESVREAVPKELDETDEEFWSSDEENYEENRTLERMKKYPTTPEFTPEYPAENEEGLIVSDEMFSYLLRVNHHGMFAVWTHGLADIDLSVFHESTKGQKPPKNTSSGNKIKSKMKKDDVK